jgi:predicted metalloprotease with PDZ domain
MKLSSQSFQSDSSALTLSYDVNLFDPHKHLLLVTLTVESQAENFLQKTLSFSLPAWIPGSYLVRDFSRHITQISAQDETRKQCEALKLDKIDKQTWQVETSGRASKVSVSMLVYAWDLSVRGAHFDQTHCFFNGTSLFLRLIGFEHCKHTVRIQTDVEALKGWTIATAMQRRGTQSQALSMVNKGASAYFESKNYDELIDHPFEIGRFQYARFKACGATHHVAITGRAAVDIDRLCVDLKKICEAQITFFEPITKKAPFKEYWFLVTAVGDGYGGLEHRGSTALICNRNDLPFLGLAAITEQTPHEGYKTFLGLCSHEYFHTWHVKRIKPSAFEPYNLNGETYTRLLWVFEGFTSYYDDLFLVRAGLIDRATYLKTLASTFSSVQKTPGRLRQSAAESSFDAWTKYYKQDENSVNAIVSYYTKGALIALALDLSIRKRSKNGKNKNRSLDDVMRLLWQEFKNGSLLDEHAFGSLLERATGIDLFLEIQHWAYGTQDIAWESILTDFGLELQWTGANKDAVWLGAKLSTPSPAGINVQNAVGHGPLAKAGVSAGDTLIAINELKADERSLAGLLARGRPGDLVSIVVFRRDELMRFQVQLEEPPKNDAVLATLKSGSRLQLAMFDRWLQPDNGNNP